MSAQRGYPPALPLLSLRVQVFAAALALAAGAGFAQQAANPVASGAAAPVNGAAAKEKPAKVAPGTPPLSASDLFLQTEAAFILHRDHAKARQGFLRVVQLDPSYAAAWFNLAVLAESGRSWLKAEGYFRRYLALQPNGPDAPRAKEQLELLRGYASGAITPAASKAAAYDAAIQRARAFLANGYFRASIAEAGRAQSLDGARWEAYAVVSLCMAKQDKPQEASSFADLAVSHAPPDKRDQIRAALSPSGDAAAQ